LNLLCDESVDAPIVEALRQDGFEVVYIAELAPSVSDDEVLATANRNAALLVTGDKDFGELVFRQRRVAAGVVLIRLAGLSVAEKAATVSRVFRDPGTHTSAMAVRFQNFVMPLL
jgi:predicted nuclease of predicted toxin-antitoxin system